MDLITVDDFNELYQNGFIVDARGGGFLIGRSHDDGNVYMIRKINTGDYEVFASMEGGEYILNHVAVLLHRDRIEFINNDKSKSVPLTYDSIVNLKSVLCTKSHPFDKLLLFDDNTCFIINKTSTSAYLRELDELNNSYR